MGVVAYPSVETNGDSGTSRVRNGRPWDGGESSTSAPSSWTIARHTLLSYSADTSN